MWLFLSQRFRTWLLLAVGVPVARAGIGRLHERSVRKDPASRSSRVLGRADAGLARVDRRERKRRRAEAKAAKKAR